jgi:hypothetical protein
MLNYNTPYEVWYRRYYDSESSDSEAGKGDSSNNNGNGGGNGGGGGGLPPPDPIHPTTDPEQYVATMKRIPAACLVMERDSEKGSSRDTTDWFPNATDGDTKRIYLRNQIIQWCRGPDGGLAVTSSLHRWADTKQFNWHQHDWYGATLMFPYWKPALTCWSQGLGVGSRIVIQLSVCSDWVPARQYDAVKVCYRLVNLSTTPHNEYPAPPAAYNSAQYTLAAGQKYDFTIDFTAGQMEQYADKNPGEMGRVGIKLWLEYATTSDMGVTSIDVRDTQLKQDTVDNVLTNIRKVLDTNNGGGNAQTLYGNNKVQWVVKELWTCMPGDFCDFEVLADTARNTTKTFQTAAGDPTKGIMPYHISGNRLTTVDAPVSAWYGYPNWFTSGNAIAANTFFCRFDHKIWANGNISDADPKKSWFFGCKFDDVFNENRKFNCGIFAATAARELIQYPGIINHYTPIAVTDNSTPPHSLIKSQADASTMTADEWGPYQFSPPYCEGLSWFNEGTIKDYDLDNLSADGYIWFPTGTKFIIRLMKGYRTPESL